MRSTAMAHVSGRPRPRIAPMALLTLFTSSLRCSTLCMCLSTKVWEVSLALCYSEIKNSLPKLVSGNLQIYDWLTTEVVDYVLLQKKNVHKGLEDSVAIYSVSCR